MIKILKMTPIFSLEYSFTFSRIFVISIFSITACVLFAFFDAENKV